MSKRFEQLAERVATDLSRRNFLSWLGRGALTTATVAACLLAPPDAAEAATVCAVGSDRYCRGLAPGAYCQIGTTGGRCQGAPACRCVPVRPRGGGGRR